MSLENAIRAFIVSGGDRTKMLVPLWAQTYRVDLEEVRREWERQMSKASQYPNNTCEIPEGK